MLSHNIHLLGRYISCNAIKRHYADLVLHFQVPKRHIFTDIENKMRAHFSHPQVPKRISTEYELELQTLNIQK